MAYLGVCIVLIAFAGVTLTAPGKLPADFKLCKQSDPKLNECLKDAVADALPKVAKGVPSLGVPPIDPLEITSLIIGEGSGPINVNLEFKNIKLEGFSSGEFQAVKMDVKKYILDIIMKFNSPIRIHGPYKVDGRVLVLPITGNGNCNLTLADLTAAIHAEGEPMQKNGESYMKIKTFNVKFETSRLYIYLENLFNGDRALGDNMNSFLNENWRDILQELKSPIEAALGASYQHIAARFFAKVPYNQIFLDK